MGVPPLTRARTAALLVLLVGVGVPSEYAYSQSAEPSLVVMDALVAAGFAVAGLVAWGRRPHVPIGAMIYLIGLLWLVPGLRYGGVPAFATTIGWVVQFSFIFLGAVLLGFPTGRVSGRFDRTLMAVLIFDLTIAIWVQLPFFDPVDFPDGPQGPNLLRVAPNREIATVLGSVQGMLTLALAIAFLVRIAVRIVRATPPARHVLMPVVGAAVGSLGGLVLYLSGLIPFIAYDAFLLLIPGGLLLGVLRSRVTRSGVGDLVVALDRGVDAHELRDLLARALGDPSLELGFAVSDGYVDAGGRPLRPSEDRAVTALGDAVLIHDPALLDDDSLLEAVGAAARMALDNARLQAQVRAQLEEVRASRQRIVEAGDEERRRIERNLHDGAQHRLLSLTLELTLLRGEVGPEARDRLDRVIDEARSTLGEVRELARGIHPQVLSNEGLGAALETLAERAPLSVHLEVDLPRRPPEAVEAAAWFVASEGVANSVKHARASELWLSAREKDGALWLSVRDNGQGHASFVAGGGLTGLRDRLGALNGVLTVEDCAGGGTTLSARIPLDPTMPNA